ncbi:cytidine deaminase [Dysgonomonas sp. 25]|uniref:cytidine deaminase n=1 Tax=Dysgonomonas sp. 25 TaxID=2302933 RepID=UPI0013D7300E|nr:cytidine deaminase [Dysgonomonas sp. 25]NDV69731.1 cytidine deaminase [Dysgonomonas sp. 25]
MNVKTISTKIRIYKIAECDNEKKMLIEKAQEATQKAYAPYSHYHVGCAVLLSSGIVVTGNNQENAAYPSGLCAERTTLFYANAQYPADRVVAVAIAASFNNSFSREVCTPCGACRQVMTEFENKGGAPFKVLMCSDEYVYEVDSAKDLLPLSFGADSMI